jgi:hypothetical protein
MKVFLLKGVRRGLFRCPKCPVSFEHHELLEFHIMSYHAEETDFKRK